MATSGSFTTGAVEGRSLTFSWSQTSQSVENNSTTISWTLKGSGSSGYVNVKNVYVTINGTQRSYQTSAAIKCYVGTTVASGTETIYHNSDGTKSFDVTVEAGIYTYTTYTTKSASFTLDTIAIEIPYEADVSDPSPYVSSITVGSMTYDLKDSTVRNEINITSLSLANYTTVGDFYSTTALTFNVATGSQTKPTSAQLVLTSVRIRAGGLQSQVYTNKGTLTAASDDLGEASVRFTLRDIAPSSGTFKKYESGAVLFSGTLQLTY